MARSRRGRRGRLGVTGTPTGPVLVERRSEVLVVTINRPEARNAVNPAVAAGIGRAMDLLDDDDELRVGVITGAQGAFCAGLDLRHAAETGERPNIKGRGRSDGRRVGKEGVSPGGSRWSP